MSKRKYTNLKVLLPEIKSVIAEGKTHREIEGCFRLTGERPIHHLLKQEDVRQKVKYAVIYRHRDEYLVSVMCKFFGVSRSGYYDFIKR